MAKDSGRCACGNLSIGLKDSSPVCARCARIEAENDHIESRRHRREELIQHETVRMVREGYARCMERHGVSASLAWRY